MQANKAWQIIYEDGEVLVVDKPAGLLTSTVPREPRPTLLAEVRQYVQRRQPRARVGLIHRLDRDAQGLLVFSKSHRAYESLKSQFYHHTVARQYTVVVEGSPRLDQQSIRSRLLERADGTVYSTNQRGKGQAAVTEVEVVSRHGRRAVLRVTLLTGRKHQVRVHLSENAMPIVGDRMYGKPDRRGLHLAATFLAFDHPRTGKRMEFQLPPPAWLDSISDCASSQPLSQRGRESRPR
jgi:23S rRNA pseudouridine1911/1915/1917 synthase